MASAALESFNAWVDSLKLAPELDAALKARAKQLYREASTEQIDHIRYHAEIVAADDQEAVERKERAAAVADVAASLVAKGDRSGWWDLIGAPLDGGGR